MQKLILTLKLFLIIGVVTFGLTACQKNKLNDETEVASSENLTLAESADEDVQIAADQAVETGDVSDLRLSAAEAEANLLGCATVTRDTVSSPRIITIDFGTGCEGRNGKIRKGKIIVSYTGRYRDAGTIIHITTDNFYVNDNKVDITRTVTNNGLVNDKLNYTIVSDRTITFVDGRTSTSHANKIRSWESGSNTPAWSDDVYKITGTGTHTSKNGIVYDVSTLTALTRDLSCHQFTAGELKIIRHGRTDRYGVINYGDGTCDNVAQVTLDNGRTFNITLH